MPVKKSKQCLVRFLSVGSFESVTGPFECQEFSFHGRRFEFVDDPDGLLSGESKLGRHMKLTRLEELPRERVRAWLKRAARLAIGPARAREG